MEEAFVGTFCSEHRPWNNEANSKWNFCPICGTSRPKPKKTLAEELRNTFQEYENQAFDGWIGAASKAREYILDGKEQAIAEIICGDQNSAQLLGVAKAILDYLKKEAQ